MKLNTYLTIGASVFALACPVSAMAQSDTQEASSRSNDPNEIIVSATRRDESVLDVAASVVAFSQESLDRQGVRNIEDLIRVTPGVNITGSSFGLRYISIRGLETRTTNGAALTAIYIDDTPIQSRTVATTTNFFPAIFDLERVEVLRGPQGTLFGAGAMGGAVRYITAKPSVTEYSGTVRGELAITEGGDWTWEAGAAVGGPIVQDKIGFRVSANYRRDGGWVDRVPFYDYRGTPEQDSNSSDNFAGSAALTFAPTENLTLTPSVFYQQYDRHDTEMWVYYRPLTPGGPVRPQPEPFTNIDGVASFSKDKAVLYTFKAEYDAGPFSLISSTSMLDRKYRNYDDSTNFLLDAIFGDFTVGGAFPFLDERVRIELWSTQKSFTQEVRLQSNADNDSRFSYVLGLFYQNSRQTFDERDYVLNPDAYLFPSALLPNGNLGRSFLRTRDKQYAAFANLDYELFDGLTLSAGARISRVEYNYRDRSDATLLSGFVADANRADTKETPITPKFAIEYKPSDNLLLYGSVSKGFRPGGVNTPLPATCTQAQLDRIGYSNGAPNDFSSDSVWSYEIGAKGRIGRALTFAASAFNIEWDDIQQGRAVLPVGGAGCTAVFSDNFGKARSRGFDAQITVSPLEGLSFLIGAAYQNATYLETIPGVNRAGQKIALTSPWAVNLSTDYATEVSDGVELYGRVQYDFKGSYTNTLTNAFTRRVDDQHYTSARLGVRSGAVDVSAFVNNLTNSRDVLFGLNFGGERVTVTSQRPRTWGLSAGYRF